MSTGLNELTAFHQFVVAQLNDSTVPPTPEQCLEMWRMQHPTAEELQQSSLAVERALQNMEAGDAGKSARSLIEEARQRLGLVRDA